MISLLLGLTKAFASKELSTYLSFAHSIHSNLDTPEEREHVANVLGNIVADGKIQLTEWSQLGKTLGILTSNGRQKKR